MAWAALRPYLTCTSPATKEQILSMPIHDGTPLWRCWNDETSTWRTPYAEPAQLDAWRTVLSGPATALQCGDWVLTEEPPHDGEIDENPINGQRHWLFGYLLRLQTAEGAGWNALLYLFTVADGWSATCEYYVNSHELMHATVEPWPGRLEEAPAHVTLVGPTRTHWAAARHRLRWGGEHPFYSSILHSKAAVIRAHWTQERQGRARVQPRTQTMMDEIGLPAKLTLGQAFAAIDSAPWRTKLANFARMTAMGIARTGRRLGLTDTRCLLCKQHGSCDSVLHIYDCCANTAAVRDWTRRALQLLADWQPPADGMAAFLVYGASRATPVTTALRGVAIETIRAARASRIQAAKSDPPVDAPVPTALEHWKKMTSLLRSYISHEWNVAQEADDDGSIHAFETRWGAVVTPADAALSFSMEAIAPQPS